MNLKPSDNYVIPLCIVSYMICMFAALGSAQSNWLLIGLVAGVFYPLTFRIHYMLERDLEQFRREYRNDR